MMEMDSSAQVPEEEQFNRQTNSRYPPPEDRKIQQYVEEINMNNMMKQRQAQEE